MSHFLPQEASSNEPPPQTLIGYASVRSQGGTSVFELTSVPTSAVPFHGRESDRGAARQALESSGFTILSESRLGYSVAGAPGAYEALTGGRVEARERLLHAEAGQRRYVTHFDIVGAGQPRALGLGAVQSAASGIEGLLIEHPRISAAAVTPAPIPPAVSRFHLRAPDDLAVALNAQGAQQQGHTGGGINITMIDSGHYTHPFFLAHHCSLRPVQAIVPGTSPTKDPVGHGTGESANIFAVAPAVTLQPIRVSDNQGNLVAVIAGLQAAKAAVPRPGIITNSWGGDLNYPPDPQPPAEEQAIVAEVLDAIEQGIVVVFSAGNGQFSIEPQIPGVIAAGGTYLTPQQTLIASDYASGYASPWQGFQDVPTVSGLVGLLPRAQYLLLPIPPRCKIDVEESQPQGGDPGDGTQSNDGWALFSGTSAAAPQIAGVCALLLQAKPNLTPEQVHNCLVQTAVDVVAGHCNPRFNNPATPGPDLATGAGLVNAAAAVQYALAHFP